MSESTYLTTGIASLDEVVGGLPQGGLTVVCSAPGGGKTSLAMQLCYGTAVQGKRASYIGAGVDGDLLARRIREGQTC